MLSLKNVTIHANEFKDPIFEQLNFTLDEGQYVCLRSGSQDGATTFLKALAGLEELHHGQCYFRDKDIHSYSDQELFAQICLCHEHNGLLSFFTNIQNIYFPIQYHQDIAQAELDTRIDHYAEQLGIASVLHFEPWQLNDVQYRLMNLLRALVIQPAVILLDEFQAGMSDEMVETLTEFLKQQCQANNLSIIEVVTAGDKTSHADIVYRINNKALELTR